MQGVQGISDIITIPGLVNVDFADVKAVMCNSGTAMLGVGVATGKNRAEEAALVRTPPSARLQFMPCCFVGAAPCVRCAVSMLVVRKYRFQRGYCKQQILHSSGRVDVQC